MRHTRILFIQGPQPGMQGGGGGGGGKGRDRGGANSICGEIIISVPSCGLVKH